MSPSVLRAHAPFAHFLCFAERPRPWTLCVGWSLPRLTLNQLSRGTLATNSLGLSTILESYVQECLTL